MSPFNRAHTTSCSPFIETMHGSTYLVPFRDSGVICRKLHISPAPYVYLSSPLGATLGATGISPNTFGYRKPESIG